MEFLEILKVILLGIIEGITEWLPISSTGHMKLFESIPNFALNGVSEHFPEMFEYVIQFAAILAVIVHFWGKLFPLKKDKEQEGKIVWKMESLTLWVKVIIACIPAALALGIDMLFEKIPQNIETLIIALALIVYGVIFILVEKYNVKQPKMLVRLQV